MSFFGDGKPKIKQAQPQDSEPVVSINLTTKGIMWEKHVEESEINPYVLITAVMEYERFNMDLTSLHNKLDPIDLIEVKAIALRNSRAGIAYPITTAVNQMIEKKESANRDDRSFQ